MLSSLLVRLESERLWEPCHLGLNSTHTRSLQLTGRIRLGSGGVQKPCLCYPIIFGHWTAEEGSGTLGSKKKETIYRIVCATLSLFWAHQGSTAFTDGLERSATCRPHLQLNISLRMQSPYAENRNCDPWASFHSYQQLQSTISELLN